MTKLNPFYVKQLASDRQFCKNFLIKSSLSEIKHVIIDSFSDQSSFKHKKHKTKSCLKY